MKQLRKIRVGIFAIALAVVASSLGQTYTNAANTLPGSNALISVDGTGQPSNSNAGAGGPYSASSDGNIILFGSNGTNMPNITLYSPTIAYNALYVRDIKAGTTTRVDTSTSGVPGDYGAGGAVLSETGRYVAFTSSADNLIDGCTMSNRFGQTYVKDLQTGATSLLYGVVSGSTCTGAGNASGTGTGDYVMSISNDGRYVNVESKYTGSPYWSPYVLDRFDTTTPNSFVSIAGQTGASTDNSIESSASCDGAFIVYAYQSEIYLADMRGATPKITSISGSNTNNPHISCNGDYVTYVIQNSTGDPTPVPTGVNPVYTHLIEYNRITGARSYIDSNSGGTFDPNHYIIPSAARPLDYFQASVADTGDVVFKYNGVFGLKHISDQSGTFEGIQKTSSGTYLTGSPVGAFITPNAKYIALTTTQSYDLGLIPAASSINQVVRAATGL